MTRRNAQRVIAGIPGSPGIAIGPAYVETPIDIDPTTRDIAPDEAEAEVARFQAAVAQSKEQLEAIRNRVADLLVPEPRLILETNLLILEDEMLVGDTIRVIRTEKVAAEVALRTTMDKVRAAFETITDEYFRERVNDVDQVAERILRNLAGHVDGAPLAERARDHVIVHHDLTPADTAQLRRGMVMGFVTDTGGKTSHTVIMARSLEIPAVVGATRATAEIDEGAMVILDGSAGIVIVDPDESTLEDYRRRKQILEDRERRLRVDAKRPAITRDGVRIHLHANLELPQEAETAVECGADGVGMFRTEFLFMNRRDLPDEEQQYLAYRQVVEDMKGRPTTIRTLDIGGDKLFSPADRPSEANPALGLRAIRYCLKEPALFRTQLRAILRAAAHGPVRILVPLVSGVDELRRTKIEIDAARESLATGGVGVAPVELGVMIEVPSAALISDMLAREVDYFSLGTNDLIQYSLAIDRGNEDVAYLYEPMHPAMLRLLKMVLDAAAVAGRRVNLCGEMGGEPQYLPVLLGLGLREISMHAAQIPRMKRWVASIDVETSKKIAAKALTLATAKEVREYVSSAAAGFEPPTTADGG
jgi:phosphoenolpyruvate-protein phosphotransferase (PTS system enzyme I)